ncbi:MAG TPA: hypothetical protein PKE42_01900 [Arachnia sp.]|nr:hypothetical protein [Arachnia sp.]
MKLAEPQHLVGSRAMKRCAHACGQVGGEEPARRAIRTRKLHDHIAGALDRAVHPLVRLVECCALGLAHWVICEWNERAERRDPLVEVVGALQMVHDPLVETKGAADERHPTRLGDLDETPEPQGPLGAHGPPVGLGGRASLLRLPFGRPGIPLGVLREAQR